MSEGGNFFKGPYADEIRENRTWQEQLRNLTPEQKAEYKRRYLAGEYNRPYNRPSLDSGDQIEFSLEEQIERAEWELATAQSNLFKLQKKLQDSGLAEVDTTPGRELEDYSKKHG